MVHAFIMVKTDAGASERTLEVVRGLESVTEAHIVAGDWDLITEVDAEEVYSVLHAASSEIQRIEGVSATKTYIAMD